MAVRTYSDMDSVISRPAPATTVRRMSGEMIFLYVAWTLAAIFWAFTMNTGLGILRLVSGAPATADVGASGGGWALMNMVGAAVLGLAIAYGAFRYFTRDKSKDALTEAATHAEYDMVEAAGGDDDIHRSPDAREPMDRDAARAVLDRGDPSTGATRH